MKKLKDSQINLEQLHRDNILMRQDISTFEAYVEEKFDISNRCEKMI